MVQQRGFLRDAEVEIMRQPKAGYATKHIRAREGLDRSYCVYSKERFLGVALYDDKKEYILRIRCYADEAVYKFRRN